MIKKDDVKRSANISKIKLDEAEIEKYTDDLNDMINFINMIDNKNFDDEKMFKSFDCKDLYLREDKINPSFCREEVFFNTSLNSLDFFCLKRKEKDFYE